MKKYYLIILILLIVSHFASPAVADDLGMGESSSGVENAWYGQKQITDEDFEKTLTKLQEKKKGAAKKKFKGTSLKKEEDGANYLNELSDKNLLLTLPIELITADGQEIQTGHYKVVGRKDKGKVYLEFRQAYSLVATVDAVESNSDFGEPTINFVKILPYDETKVKIIYGSIDFNATTFINIKNILN